MYGLKTTFTDGITLARSNKQYGPNWGIFNLYQIVCIGQPSSPVVHGPRKVPIELKDKLQAELREMESQDIIAKVTQPTDWSLEKKKMGDFVYASIPKT